MNVGSRRSLSHDQTTRGSKQTLTCSLFFTLELHLPPSTGAGCALARLNPTFEDHKEKLQTTLPRVPVHPPHHQDLTLLDHKENLQTCLHRVAYAHTLAPQNSALRNHREGVQTGLPRVASEPATNIRPDMCIWYSSPAHWASMQQCSNSINCRWFLHRLHVQTLKRPPRLPRCFEGDRMKQGARE